MSRALQALHEAELQGLARVLGRLLTAPTRQALGSHPHRTRAGNGSEFLDFRELLPGDSLRDVDWRATARCSRPQIRRYRDERSADWMLCLDRSASMGVDGGRKWDLAIQLSAALAYLLLYLDHRVGLILFSSGVDDLYHPGRGRSAYGGLLRHLQEGAPARAGGASRLGACVPHLRAGNQVVVVSDFLAPDAMTSALGRLAQRGERVHALQILAPSDASVATEGATCLQDIESGRRLRTVVDAALQRRTERRLTSHIERLQRHCRHHHIAFSHCRSGDHWKQVLLTHLRAPTDHHA